jgi:hypothetical protein
LSVFAGGFACPTDEFPLSWPSTPAKQPGGLDTKATEQERTHEEQRAAMLTVAVQEYIADVRPVFGERTA